MDEFDYTNKDVTPRQPDQHKPWWNDADKMGGLFATAVTIAVAIVLIGGAIKLVTMMF